MHSSSFFCLPKKRSACSVWLLAMSSAWHFKSSLRQQNDPKKCSMNRYWERAECLWFHVTEFPFPFTAIESIWIHSYFVCERVILARFGCSLKCKFDPFTHIKLLTRRLYTALPSTATLTGLRSIGFHILFFNRNNYSLDIIFDLFINILLNDWTI